ncbi:MAG: hypothetical protein ACOZAO_01545 [Patescibacteria group bacterium]
MVREFVIKYDKQVHRLLEIIPGMLTWAFILSPVWLSLIYPEAVVYLLTFITVYWSYLAVKGTLGSIMGYIKYKNELKVDWMLECSKLEFSTLPDKKTLPKNLESIKHFILIPVVNEPVAVLKPAIDAVFNQTFPVNQTTLVFTAEEKYQDQVKANVLEAIGDRIDKLEQFMFFVHPAGIPGEAIGVAAANRTWGAKHAVQKLVNENQPIRDFIFTTIDCDHVLHEQYIARLTHLYLTSDKRDNRFYSSAVYTFNNNSWDVPTLMRMEASFVTIGTLSDWAFHDNAPTKDNFAAYSTSLQTLIDADYWDPALGIDDTIYYWRAFFARNGDYVGTPHYIPFSADAVQGKTFLESHVSMYKQLLRWGYGVIDFPLSVKGFLTNKEVSLSKKIMWTMKHLHKRILLVNMVFLMTFGFGIATLTNPNIKQTSFAYSLPDMMSVILTFTMVFFVPGIIIRSKISRPMPKTWPVWKKALVFLESPLVIVNLLTYSFIPYVDAQTRMMLGKKMKDHYHTPKVRNAKSI